jgi:hypothetical protein
MTWRFFTVFDKNYTARGLIMLESLRRVCRAPLHVTVLALDNETARAVRHQADEILRVDDLGDAEFAASKSNRPHAEFCWSAAAVLSAFMLRRADLGEIVVYVDADLYFFADPSALIAEMGSDKNILIHPHRFSPDLAGKEKAAGIFNVGLVGFRTGSEARACVARWRDQVLASCTLDPERGLCGDQGYLDEWPALYPGLQIMEHIGGGAAPWNITAYRVTGSPGSPSVDGMPIVFYHFHQLRTIDVGPHRFLGVAYASGYFFSPAIKALIYRDYVRALKRQTVALMRSGIDYKPQKIYSATVFHRRIRSGEADPVLDGLGSRLRYALSLLEYFRERITEKYFRRRSQSA